MRGHGCNFCAQTGFLERIGVYEMMPVTERIRELVLRPGLARRDPQGRPAPRACARCRRRPARLVETGVTTLAEVLRSIYVVGS